MKHLIALSLIGLLILTACSTPAATPEQTNYKESLPILSRNFDVGITQSSPKGFPRSTEQDITTYYNTITDNGNLQGVLITWDPNDKNAIPKQVSDAMSASEQYGYTPVIILGFDAEDKYFFLDHGKDYRKTALAIAETYHPKYLALGNNVNEYYAKSPEGFDIFTRQYQDLYDDIKKVSPDTHVFTIFQLESIKGKAFLNQEDHKPQWYLLDEFNGKMDVAGFTSYPFLQYQTPQEIPADYYTELAQKTDKPIVFTGIGWPSQESYTNAFARLNDSPWVGNEQEQVDFLITFLDRTQTMNKEFVLWQHDHDARGEKNILNSAGLIENNGKEKKVYSYWKALVNLE